MTVGFSETTFPFRTMAAYFESTSKNKAYGFAELLIGYGRATTSIFRGLLSGPRSE